MKSILFVDNNPDFANTRAEFLEMAGYRVQKATTLDEAERCMRERWAPLAILDVRLVDDGDEKDLSGLTLARMESCRPIIKIVLTGYPTPDLVRELLRLQNSGRPLAVDFLAKEEGPGALVEAVSQAFAEHVRINWDLEIDWKARDPFALVNLIELGLEGERLLNRVEELGDLFRRLFYEKNQIKVDRLLWHRVGRVALRVFAFAEGKAPESLIVVCGRNAPVAEEAWRYRNFAPKAPGDLSTVLNRSAETTHFAANTYALASADLENVLSLAELYRTGTERSFNTALDTLLQKTLVAWSQGKRIPEGMKSLSQVYHERLGLFEKRMPPAAFEERLQVIVDQAPTLGTRIERAPGQLTIRFNEHSFSYPDPTPILYQTSAIEYPVLLLHTSGTLSGDNILVDNNGRTWLTDFADAGLAPLLWNFVMLEAVIRFDWNDTQKFQWLHDMEQCLVAGEFSKLDTRDLELPLRKPVRAIQVIRRLASQTVGKNALPYHLGLLFHAASRIADFNPAFRLMPNELARLTHALMATAMICSRIVKGEQASASPAALDVAGMRVDKANYAVWLDGIRVSLRGQSYDLLCYLYEHADNLCTRREILAQVFRQEYDETDQSQRSLLNTAIRRLREKIEDDPDRPRYLLTEHGGGYRLVIQPK
ncbi:MAG: DNA-binding response regulator [Gammaproteobacteria bacterium]|nr:DNA-binding response regulator [Gammaproteobacteria bacterium]